MSLQKEENRAVQYAIKETLIYLTPKYLLDLEITSSIGSIFYEKHLSQKFKIKIYLEQLATKFIQCNIKNISDIDTTKKGIKMLINEIITNRDLSKIHTSSDLHKLLITILKDNLEFIGVKRKREEDEDIEQPPNKKQKN